LAGKHSGPRKRRRKKARCNDKTAADSLPCLFAARDNASGDIHRLFWGHHEKICIRFIRGGLDVRPRIDKRIRRYLRAVY